KAELDEKVYKELADKTGQVAVKVEPHQERVLQLAKNLGNFPISNFTETKVLTNGKKAFPKMLEEMKKAKHHIHLEFYIVRDDELGKEIKDVLIEKAKSGVEVRFLYDGVGSWQLGKAYKEEMREAGIEIIPFLPVKLP